MSSMMRARWAALGAAVAVTLGAGGFGLVQAVQTSGERATFVSITPCRLMDTRAAAGVPGRQTPLGPGEVITQNAHGNNGQCVGIPADATALSLNVTAFDATGPTFLSFWPTGVAQPNASSLNPAPGQPPTPNAVITDISPAGQFNLFNERSTVNMIVDINGYYVDHNHDDRYYTEAEVDARAPKNDSLTLAGGGFVARDGTQTLLSGTACFSNTTPVNGLRHTIPVTAGTTLTGLTVRTTDNGTGNYTVTVLRQSPGSTAGPAVASVNRSPVPGLNSVDLPFSHLVAPGEALYVVFSASSSTTNLCAVDVRFTRPG